MFKGAFAFPVSATGVCSPFSPLCSGNPLIARGSFRHRSGFRCLTVQCSRYT